MMISGALPERGVEQAADGRAQEPGERLGGVAHQARQRDDRQRRGQEHQDRVGPEPVQAEGDRDEDQQPVQVHGVAPARARSSP